MSKYINDIDDQEFVETVIELESKNGFFDKLYYSMDKTGVQCILPEDFVTRTIDGKKYFWGFKIEKNYEFEYILNLLCNHHHRLFYDGLVKSFFDKTKDSPFVLVPGVIDFELEEIKKKLNNQEEYFKLGYRLQKGGEKMHTINNDIPTDMIACSMALGSSSYIFEVFLNESLKLHTLEANKKYDVPDTGEEPAFTLQNQYEKLLYFKYSGLLESIINVVGNNNKKISKIISQITGENAESLRVMLAPLIVGYNKTNKDHNLYRRSCVENTINALVDTGFDTTELMKIYAEIASD